MTKIHPPFRILLTVIFGVIRNHLLFSPIQMSIPPIRQLPHRTFRDQDNRYSSLGGHWVKYREIPLEDLHYRICVLHHGNMEGRKSITTFLRGTGSPQVMPGWTLFALICTRKSTSHFHLCDFTDITLKNAMRKSIDQMKQQNYLFRWLRTWLEWKAQRWQESVTFGKH